MLVNAIIVLRDPIGQMAEIYAHFDEQEDTLNTAV
jgi:hypothetical protein